MNKFLLLLIGLLLALITLIAYLEHLINLPPLFNITLQQKNLLTGKPVTSEPVSLTLNLSSPDDNLLVFEPDILIAGKTSPSAPVVISQDQTDQVVLASSQGEFSISVKLQKGVNNLDIMVFDNLGNSKSEGRTIYYSTEKL